MVDVFTKAKRSWLMARIKGRNTKPEEALVRYLRKAGFRVRRFVKNLPGTPDLVLPEQHMAVFVHGCFWHGHRGCARARLPASNHRFWRTKIAKNRQRDLRQARALRRQGWSVAVFWTCRALESNNTVARIHRIVQDRGPSKKAR